MPTEPLRSVLDPEFAVVGAKDIIELTAPLLREVVNHATQAHMRCQAYAIERGGVDEDVAPHFLHRTIMDMTDAMEVLARQSCGAACVPLVRTSFEALLALEYILKEDTPRRSLCWFCVYYIHRLGSYRLFSPDHPWGVKFQEAYVREFATTVQPSSDLKASIANLEALLARPHLATIVSEYQRRSKGSRRPHWYSLFEGPANLRELAEKLNHGASYSILYRQWSGSTHAHDISSYLTPRKDGSPGTWSMRYSRDLPTIAQFAALFMMRATRLLLKQYRGGEDLSRWYLSEVKPKLEALGNTAFTVDVIEA